MATAGTRPPLVTIHMSEAERQSLREVAALKGTTISGLIRRGLAAEGVALEKVEVPPAGTYTRKRRKT